MPARKYPITVIPEALRAIEAGTRPRPSKAESGSDNIHSQRLWTEGREAHGGRDVWR